MKHVLTQKCLENECDLHLCYNASQADRLSIHFSASKYLLLCIITAMEAWRRCGIGSYQEILANRQAAGELSENSSDYSFLFEGLSSDPLSMIVCVLMHAISMNLFPLKCGVPP